MECEVCIGDGESDNKFMKIMVYSGISLLIVFPILTMLPCILPYMLNSNHPQEYWPLPILGVLCLYMGAFLTATGINAMEKRSWNKPAREE